MGIKHSVIDIAKDAKNDVPTTYYGRNGYTITLSRIDNPRITKEHGNDEKQSLKNYKQYHHKIPEDNAWWSVYYQLQRVEHNGIEQTGFEEKGYLKTHKALEVVYWSNDEHNSLPLIIGLGEGKPTYFKRENETNRWERANNIVPPADLSDYNRVLSELNEKFRNVVIVNLNAENGQKYCGHPSLNCFKSPTESSDSNCSQDSTSFVTITVSDCIDTKIPRGFKCLKHSPSESNMRVLGTYHGKSMIPFTESILATEYESVNAYHTSENRNDKPLLLELQEEHQGTSKLYTLGNNGWMPSNLSKNDLIKALDYENCRQNNIVVADVSKKEKYHCTCKHEKHREIHVSQNRNNVLVGSELYEHTLESTGGRETPEPSFNKYRFMDDIKDVTLPESPVTDVKKIYVYLCKSNTNMQLLIYMDSGSEPGKWLRKIYGGNTWTEANSVSLSGAKPTDSSSKEKIGKGLEEICKELKTNGCKHTTSTPPISTSPSTSADSSGSSQNSSGEVASGSPSIEGQGDSISSGDSSGPKNTQNQVDRAGPPGSSATADIPNGGSALPTTKPDSSDSSDRGNVGREADSKSSDNNKTPTEESKTDTGGKTRADETDLKKIVREAVTFITTHPTEISGGVGGVLGTGILGLVVWKAPALVSKVLAICITSV